MIWQRGAQLITFVESKEEQKNMMALCKKSAFGCKIAGIANAYGFDKKFACFWTDNRDKTVFCMLDNTVLISGTVTNTAEAAAFLHAVGASEIFCAVRNAEALSLKTKEMGDVLLREILPGNAGTWQQPEVPIREVYALLEDAGMCGEFAPFYLDLSHRLRHNAAMVALEYRDEQLAGCAIVSSLTETAAVLSAVVVRENARRQGIGAELIHRLERQLGGKKIYIYKKSRENEAFYKALHYAKTDTWVTGTI